MGVGDAKGSNWLNHLREPSEASLSDKELEAKGNSWLKSSNPGRSSVRVTLPSIGEGRNYSKDSLNASDPYDDDNDDSSYSSKLR